MSHRLNTSQGLLAALAERTAKKGGRYLVTPDGQLHVAHGGSFSPSEQLEQPKQPEPPPPKLSEHEWENRFGIMAEKLRKGFPDARVWFDGLSNEDKTLFWGGLEK